MAGSMDRAGLLFSIPTVSSNECKRRKDDSQKNQLFDNTINDVCNDVVTHSKTRHFINCFQKKCVCAASSDLETSAGDAFSL